MILIVDDNPDNLYSLKKLLESKDFKVDTAHNGEEALLKALKNDYALIILDVQMPDMDGFEVAEILSDYSKTNDIPIIFLSAVNTDKRFITQGYASGGKDYVTKPVDAEILLLKVETFYSLQAQSIAMKKTQKSLKQEAKGRAESQLLMKSQLDEFHMMLESVPQIAFTLNQEGMIDYVNAKWSDYSVSETEFPETGSDDLTSIEDELERCKKKGLAVELEVRIKNLKTHEYRYHLLRIVPVYKEKLLSNWVGTFTDINDRKKVEKDKDDFLSIASHELKTPLTSIKAYVHILDRKLNIEKDSAERGYMNKVHDQIEKLNSLTSDLLDMSKIENGKLTINKSLNNLDQVIENSIDTIVKSNTNNKIKIQWIPNLDSLCIPMDALRIEQVLSNFLNNAIKYSAQNQHITVSTHIYQNEGEVKVEIKDLGIGIPDFKQESVFDKFYRVDESSLQFQGMGIGLYICSEIIKQHQGNIGVESKLGEGSTFYFTLPLS